MGDPHIILDQRCQQLAALGNARDNPEAEATLRDALDDTAWRIRSTAARTLGQLGARRELEKDTLLALLEVAGKDDIAWSRHAAAWTLCRQAGRKSSTAELIGAAVSARLGADGPGGEDAGERLYLLELARRLPPGVIDPVQVVASLQAEDWRVRAAAAMAIGVHGGAAGDSDAETEPGRAALIDALVGALGDDDPGVREAAAEGLAAVGGITAQDALLALASDPEPTVQAAGLRALGALRDGDLDTLRGAMDQALGSQHSRVRQAAAMLASHLGSAAAPLVPELIDALGDPVSAVADSVGYALVDIAAEEQALAPMLWQAVENRQGRVRVRALDLVQQVSSTFPNPHSNVETITRFLLSEMRGSTYRGATWLLQQVPLSDVDAMSVVLESLGSRSTTARWRALALLRNSPATLQTMIPVLRRVLHDSSARVRRLAAEVTPGLGAAVQPALPELARRAFEGDNLVKAAALEALQRLLGKTRERQYHYRPGGKREEIPPPPPLFPALIQDWLAQIEPKTELSDLLASRLQGTDLEPALVEEFVAASRAHAAWHNAVGEQRAKKHGVAFTPLPELDPDTAPIEIIAHAVECAQARALVHVPPNGWEGLERDRIVRREYGWHLGRLLELLNRFDAAG